MSSAHEKEQAAALLRHHAALVEVALDPLPGLSAEAWDCPAADAFVDDVRANAATLERAGSTMRSVAASLDASAAAQRAAEAAAAIVAESAATAPTTSVPSSSIS